MEFQAYFTPLHPGTIRDLFSPKRNTPAQKAKYDPLGFPEIETQCVHISSEELNEGYDFVRCVKDADLSLRHGWLCPEHGADHFFQTRREASAKQYRNKDNDVVEAILAYEKRALSVTQRQIVQVGAKIRIEYAR